MQWCSIIERLKKPSVLLSIISQIISFFMLLGLNIDHKFVMTIATIVCSILTTLGILSNPDTVNKGYGDDLLTCSSKGKIEPHLKINDQLICKTCGAVYDPELENQIL